MSTNAMIAMLRAMMHEITRLEARLSLDEEDEEVGLYLNDLHEAIAEVSSEYSRRREEDASLTAVELLLRSFSTEK